MESNISRKRIGLLFCESDPNVKATIEKVLRCNGFGCVVLENAKVIVVDGQKGFAHARTQFPNTALIVFHQDAKQLTRNTTAWPCIPKGESYGAMALVNLLSTLINP